MTRPKAELVAAPLRAPPVLLSVAASFLLLLLLALLELLPSPDVVPGAPDDVVVVFATVPLAVHLH